MSDNVIPALCSPVQTPKEVLLAVKRLIVLMYDKDNQNES